jgi:alkylation response protein AidB-like acyl-CoA dehydrogenase
MPWIDAVRSQETVEAALGDPRDSSHALSFASALEHDEREAYPGAACAELDRIGVNDHFIPAADGGRLAELPALATLFRAVARRDLTLAIAHHVTFLGAVHVWTAGTARQRERVASYLRAGGRMALAYHEEAHGGDLLASELTAEQRGDGYVLRGEKWFINNATLADLHTVFARTSPKGGPRGFSLFLVDKRALPPSAFEHTPRLKTHGARGVDFSGIRFLGAELGDEALLGEEGGGLGATLRSFQITRTLLSALSIGAGDTALRTVLDFAVDRAVHGTQVWALPRPRAQLVAVFVDLLACDALAHAATRALHVVPEDAKLWSAVAKSHAASTVARSLSTLAEVLGARSFLRDLRYHGIFQKIVRDHPAIPTFHAGGFLLLQTIAMHLPALGARRGARDGAFSAARNRLGAICDLGGPLPPFDATRLSAYAQPADPRVELASFADVVHGALDADASVRDALRSLAPALVAASTARDVAFAALASAEDGAPALFDAAEDYVALHAAVVCARVWIQNRHAMDPSLAEGHWLVLALARCLGRLGSPCGPFPRSEAQTARWLEMLHAEHRAFSVTPGRLAAGARRS